METFLIRNKKADVKVEPIVVLTIIIAVMAIIILGVYMYYSENIYFFKMLGLNMSQDMQKQTEIVRWRIADLQKDGSYSHNVQAAYYDGQKWLGFDRTPDHSAILGEKKVYNEDIYKALATYYYASFAGSYYTPEYPWYSIEYAKRGLRQKTILGQKDIEIIKMSQWGEELGYEDEGKTPVYHGEVIVKKKIGVGGILFKYGGWYYIYQPSRHVYYHVPDNTKYPNILNVKYKDGFWYFEVGIDIPEIATYPVDFYGKIQINQIKQLSDEEKTILNKMGRYSSKEITKYYTTSSNWGRIFTKGEYQEFTGDGSTYDEKDLYVKYISDENGEGIYQMFRKKKDCNDLKKDECFRGLSIWFGNNRVFYREINPENYKFKADFNQGIMEELSKWLTDIRKVPVNVPYTEAKSGKKITDKYFCAQFMQGMIVVDLSKPVSSDHVCDLKVIY